MSLLDGQVLQDVTFVTGGYPAPYFKRTSSTFTVSGQPFNVFLGVQNATNRRHFAGYSWNRRTNTQQFGEQQGIFPILGFDWRF